MSRESMQINFQPEQKTEIQKREAKDLTTNFAAVKANIESYQKDIEETSKEIMDLRTQINKLPFGLKESIQKIDLQKNLQTLTTKLEGYKEELQEEEDEFAKLTKIESSMKEEILEPASPVKFPTETKNLFNKSGNYIGPAPTFPPKENIEDIKGFDTPTMKSKIKPSAAQTVAHDLEDGPRGGLGEVKSAVGVQTPTYEHSTGGRISVSPDSMAGMIAAQQHAAEQQANITGQKFGNDVRAELARQKAEIAAAQQKAIENAPRGGLSTVGSATNRRASGFGGFFSRGLTKLLGGSFQEVASASKAQEAAEKAGPQDYSGEGARARAALEKSRAQIKENFAADEQSEENAFFVRGLAYGVPGKKQNELAKKIIENEAPLAKTSGVVSTFFHKTLSGFFSILGGRSAGGSGGVGSVTGEISPRSTRTYTADTKAFGPGEFLEEQKVVEEESENKKAA